MIRPALLCAALAFFAANSFAQQEKFLDLKAAKVGETGKVEPTLKSNELYRTYHVVSVSGPMATLVEQKVKKAVKGKKSVFASSSPDRFLIVGIPSTGLKKGQEVIIDGYTFEVIQEQQKGLEPKALILKVKQ